MLAGLVSICKQGHRNGIIASCHPSVCLGFAIRVTIDHSRSLLLGQRSLIRRHLWQQESPSPRTRRGGIATLEGPRVSIVLEDHAEEPGGSYEVVCTVACEDMPPRVALEKDREWVAYVAACDAEGVAAVRAGKGGEGRDRLSALVRQLFATVMPPTMRYRCSKSRTPARRLQSRTRSSS